jgi:hypothetical protein
MQTRPQSLLPLAHAPGHTERGLPRLKDMTCLGSFLGLLLVVMMYKFRQRTYGWDAYLL